MEGYPRNIWWDSMGIQFNLYSKKKGGKHLGSFSTSSSKEKWNKLLEDKKISVEPIERISLPRDFEGIIYTRLKVNVKFK